MARAITFLLLLALSGRAATIYVTKTGNDSTGNGSVGSPYLTVQKGVDVARAGDTILIGTGTYAENVRTADWAGSAGSPIVINGQGVATVGSFTWENPYLSIINCTLKGGTNAWGGLLYVAQPACHCVLSNCLVDAEFHSGITPVIRWNGPASYPYGAAGSGNVIISNTIQNIRGEMVFRIYGYTNLIYGNKLLNSDFADWFQCHGGSNSIVANLCSNLFYSGLNDNHADIFQTFGIAGGTQQASRGHLFESNTVMFGSQQVQIGNLSDDSEPEARDITFRNNIFIAIPSKCSCAMPGLKWYNNFFYQCGTNADLNGQVLIFGDSGSVGRGDGGQCFNNVFLDCGLPGNTNNGSGWYTFATTLTNIAADYNFCSKDGGKAVEPDPLQRMVGEAGFVTGYFWEDHGTNGGNPMVYNDGVTMDSIGRPLAGSPLLGTGTNLSTLFTTDILGATRSAWSMGPYDTAASLLNPPTLPCNEAPKVLLAYPVTTSTNVTFYWLTNQYRQGIEVARRVYTNRPTYWATWTVLGGWTNASAAAASNYVSTISSGIHYEYRIGGLVTNWPCNNPPFGWETNAAHWYYQYISVGSGVPLQDQRGNVCLLVEGGVAASLGSELTTLTNDLVGDGYKVYRHDVAAVEVTNAGWAAAVASTKSLAVSDYNSAPGSNWTLFIVGHVPIPYSGRSSPGSHADNVGAHPADWYYVCTNAADWTDSTVNDSTADFVQTHNVPSDGKWDQDFVPAVPVMRVGRVDLRNMPIFGKTEVQLLSQYLTRNHQWRQKLFTVRDYGLSNTNGRPWAAQNGFSSLFGTQTNYDLKSWIEYATNGASSALVAASAGAGHYDQDLQLGYTYSFTNAPLYIAFASTFGSYYGDWDSTYITNCFLLAPLANNGKVVSTFYDEPVMPADTSAMGEPVSQELLAVAANYSVSYDNRYIQEANVTDAGTFPVTEQVHNYVSLMGDPTLRYRVVLAPTNVTATVSGADKVLTWTATDEAAAGYHVYRAPTGDLNSMTRLTANLTTSPYTNSGAGAGDYTYMVRTVKLESSAGRSYYNASAGAFATSAGEGGGNTTAHHTFGNGRVGTLRVQ